MTFWVGVASHDHVRMAVAGGFIQLAHGKHAPVQRLSPGDWIALYSTRTSISGGEALQAFTAIGRVADGPPYEFDQAPGFRPLRRDVTYLKSRECSVRPLIGSLTFLKGGPNWGIAFRRPVFAVSKDDFERIADEMGADINVS